MFRSETTDTRTGSGSANSIENRTRCDRVSIIIAYAFIRPESEQNSSHLQIDCGVEHGNGLGCAPKVNPARQIAACPGNGLGLWCGRSSMGGCEWLGLRSASGAKSERFVRCSQTPDLPGGSGRSGSSRRESVPTDPRRNACFWQLVQESPTSPKNGRCVRFRACRQM